MIHNYAAPLVCKRVIFYSLKDEESFFEWAKKINCIEKVLMSFDSLIVHLKSPTFANQDLCDLYALFERYKIDLGVLPVSFVKSKKPRISRKISHIEQSEPAKNDTIIICNNMSFYSSLDKESFFDWIKKIDSIESIFIKDDKLYFRIICPSLYDYNLRDLLALLYRYNQDMVQLKTFLEDENKHWFRDGAVKGYWHHRVFGE